MERGRVRVAYATREGSHLAEDATSVDTELWVDDVSDFNEEGGTLTLRWDDLVDHEVIYTGVDVDEQSILGVDGMTNDYEAVSTSVWVEPITQVRWADVELQGEDDTVQCRVPNHLMDRIRKGTYDEGEGPWVLAEIDSEDWVIRDIIGDPPVLLEEDDVVDSVINRKYLGNPERILRMRMADDDTANGVQSKHFDGVELGSGVLVRAKAACNNPPTTGASIDIKVADDVVGTVLIDGAATEGKLDMTEDGYATFEHMRQLSAYLVDIDDITGPIFVYFYIRLGD